MTGSTSSQVVDHADIRIAADTAKLGFVFARRGLVPEAASSWFLPRVVGTSQAMEWVATGRVFDAAEALAGRLVSRVVPAAELMPAARALAGEIAANTSAVSVTVSRRMLWSMLGELRDGIGSQVGKMSAAVTTMVSGSALVTSDRAQMR